MKMVIVLCRVRLVEISDDKDDEPFEVNGCEDDNVCRIDAVDPV